MLGDPETHEQRSCLRKVRHSTRPELVGDAMVAYACEYCGGWHLATNKARKNGDVSYTDEGWPIVPVCVKR